MNYDFGDITNESLLIVAHELKSPLSLIRQLSLFLEQSSQSSLDQKILNQITATSERALRLANDLSRLNSKQTEFDLEPIDPMTVCNQVKYDLASWYKLHNKELIIKAKKRRYLAIANQALLKSILVNFCDNALYYAKDKSQVQLQVKQTKNRIRLSVRDYGPRVSKDIWRSLKQANFSPQTVSTRPKSSGLGIYISDKLAQKMNGQIGVISHKDGATFYVDLLVSNQLSLL